MHIAFAFPIQLNTDTFWFIGSVVALIVAELVNLISIHKGGSGFTHTAAVIYNALMSVLFCMDLVVLPEP